jgi:FtsP/CotA-like multicopper oxidase with cupredoxin domain
MKRILFAAGIVALAAVLSVGYASVPSGHTRTYYIAADQVTWNYVPSGMNYVTGKPFKSIGYFAGPNGAPVTRPVSSSYVKCLYREYTDASFRTLKPRPPQWQHLGMLGPLIRAEVGDTIRVVYRNNCNFPNSIHVHGLLYAKTSEGSPYDDGTPGGIKPGDSVKPKQTYTYVWHVPERAGPAANDPSSILWMYHSHTNDYRDFNSGLVGPLIVTARGQAKLTARRRMSIASSSFGFHKCMKKTVGTATATCQQSLPIIPFPSH